MNEVNSTVPPSGLNDGARLIVRLLVTIETSNPSTDITRISFARPPRRDAKAIRESKGPASPVRYSITLSANRRATWATRSALPV